MPLVRYTGGSHFRVLTAADAKRATPAVDDFTKTTWARGEAQEVSAPAAQWLLSMADEFEAVENKPKAGAPDQAPAKSSSKSS